MTGMTGERSYLPAAGRHWALPFYDPMVKLMGGDRARRVLLDQADLQHARRVLDIGCGTGTFATTIKRLYPAVGVVGLDPDLDALARGRRKAQQAGVAVQFDQGFSDSLPYGDASFDRAFSSFMFHHLPKDQRETTLRQVRRVLAPGGSFHLLDFDRSHASGGVLSRLHSSHHLEDNTENRLIALMRQAGFARAEKLGERKLLLGLFHIGYYRAFAG